MNAIQSDKQPAEADEGPLLVGLGEALFDCLPDRTVLGGAPVNLAVHAHALLEGVGGRALPATRVGADEILGERFFRELAERGVSTSAVQVDPEHHTGRVLVELDEQGQASYEFESNVAWDHLEVTQDWLDLASRCDAVAFGSLAQRSAESRSTITRFLKAATTAIRVFDVNLRQALYSADVLEKSLQLATAVKLNEEELTEVGRLLDMEAGAKRDADELSMLLCMTFELDWLALTRGAKGTVLFYRDVRYEGAPPTDVMASRSPDADSVGAGDACCAGLLTGMLLGWRPERTLELANYVGACVASQPGATPRLPESLLALTVDAAAGMDATS